MTATTQYSHILKITDLGSLADYSWELDLPFPLALTDDQVAQIMQIIAGGLPATDYGFKVSAKVTATTTTIDTTASTWPDIAVPGALTPPA